MWFEIYNSLKFLAYCNFDFPILLYCIKLTSILNFKQFYSNSHIFY